MANHSDCFTQSWHGQPLSAMSVRLRSIAESDAPRLMELAGEQEVSAPTDQLPHPLDPVQAIHHLLHLMATGQGVSFVIECLVDGIMVGAISLASSRPSQAVLSYWIGRPFWHGGIATEAVRRVVAFAFQDLALDGLTVSIMKNNPASRRILEKAGFRATSEISDCGSNRCCSLTVDAFTLSRTAWLAQWTSRPMLLVAAAALIDADGRVLLAQRPSGRRMAGLWEFPGGKVQEGEIPETALIRELREELGVEVRTGCLAPLSFASHPYVDFHLLMPLYICRNWRGQPQGCEGQRLHWVHPRRLATYPLPPADMPLVAALRDALGT